MHITALIGSLRKASYNRMAFGAAREALPAGVTMDEAAIGDIPLYNDDLRAGSGLPPAVSRVVTQLAAADGVLFISAEYNYSVPGVLKNAIDWVSRAPNQPLDKKPVAIMGASMGALGTGRMQYHLRQILVFLNAYTLARPEVMIGQAQDKFDATGRLTDEATRKAIKGQVDAFVAWINLIKAGAGAA